MRLARLLTFAAPATLLLALLAPPLPTARADSPVKTFYSLSLLGEPKYPADFKHFDYVNPDAPKGGELKRASIGSFDSFNPFIVKGNPAVGAAGLLFDTLLTPSQDEADASYGLLAESIELPDDHSWVAYNLRPEAKFQDGTPVTAEDVVFSFDMLTTKGDPQYALYYADVAKAEAVAPLKVKFTFKTSANRELPVILGQLPVLSKHYWEGKNFEETTLTPPLGSGPYKVASFEVGRYVTYKLDPNYWGAKLPVNIGTNNFGTQRFDYYKDPNIALIAFLAGAYDVTVESSAKNWATQYDVPAVKDGRIIRDVIPYERPAGMQCFAFNLRKPIFQDVRVREALNYAFDFEWADKNLFFGQYKRTKSFFENSELASSGLPSPEELKILEPLRGKIPDEVFTKPFTLPTTDGSGNNRANLRVANQLLEQAGWTVKNGVRVNKDGQPFRFEILLDNPLFERLALPFIQNLKRLGIDASLRSLTDNAQYTQRTRTFDYDMIVAGFGESLSPGNEQRWFWGSAAADQPGSPNLIGIKNPAIDTLIDQVINAPDRDQLVYRTRALDRVLLWNYYVIPHFYMGADRLAYWDIFDKPKVRPRYSTGFDTWWIDPKKVEALKQRGRS
jgi:microcin C transport system substrate-binding protein